jgi:hypothetical protein
MANCSAGPASCKTSCRGGCACVYEHETEECYCECFDEDDVISGTLSLSAVVSVTVSGLSLGHVAGRLDRLMKREVLVPASRSKETIKLKLRKVPLSQAIKRLGLATRPSPGKKRAVGQGLQAIARLLPRLGTNPA